MFACFSRVGLSAKEVPRQSKARQSNDPVERRLYTKLEAGKGRADESFEDSILRARDGNEDDDSSEESESRTSAFAKKRPGPLAPSLQLLSEPRACWGGRFGKRSYGKLDSGFFPSDSVESIRVLHVLRDGNQSCEFLACIGSRNLDILQVWDSSPPGLQVHLQADAVGIAFAL
ncbi:unnamed protein product [Dovyalis caffra]|uniref:Uncharacterized protein n=1 Tax=Dovyalis caffra TaxID=77055 RepID=A0AAV1S098_9ROSI|nr:unnamed protein product [Dovyalis caffra]